MAEAGQKKRRRQRRNFSEDFKAGAVRLVLDEGKSVAHVARDLDLTASALAGWVERVRADLTKGKTGLTTEERTELARLRKENKDLKMERELLKKNGRPSSRKRVREVHLHRCGEGGLGGGLDVPQASGAVGGTPIRRWPARPL